jgi:hypothetical protein
MEMSQGEKKQLADERCAEVGEVLALKVDASRCRRLTSELREHFVKFVDARHDEIDLRDRIFSAYTYDMISPLVDRLLRISASYRADTIVVDDEDPDFTFTVESDDAGKFKNQYLVNNLLSYVNEAYVLFLRGTIDRTHEGREITILERLLKRAETIRSKYSDGDNQWLDIVIPNTHALMEITHRYVSAHTRVEASKQKMDKSFDILFAILQTDIRPEVRVSVVSVCTYLFGRQVVALLIVLSVLSILYTWYGLRRLRQLPGTVSPPEGSPMVRENSRLERDSSFKREV